MLAFNKYQLLVQNLPRHLGLGWERDLRVLGVRECYHSHFKRLQSNANG